MTHFRHLVLDRLSLLLTPESRAAVLGDLTELRLALLPSVYELTGLIARQQLVLWQEWRPWLSLLGIAGLVGVRLNALAFHLISMPAIYVRTYLKHGVIYQSGLTLSEEILVWFSTAAAIVLWSWAAGFALTAIARKTALLTAMAICAFWLAWNVALVCRARPSMPWAFLFLLIPWLFFFLPAVLGSRRAFRCGDLSSVQGKVLLCATAVVLILVTWTSGWPQAGIERWSEGTFHGAASWYRRLPPYLLLSWPALWIVLGKEAFLEGKFGHKA